MTGTITRMLKDKGFGFIRSDEDGQVRFMHARSVVDGNFDALEEGDAVEFTSVNSKSKDKKGNGLRAEGVRKR